VVSADEIVLNTQTAILSSADPKRSVQQLVSSFGSNPESRGHGYSLSLLETMSTVGFGEGAHKNVR
jgi:hypothetical protein